MSKRKHYFQVHKNKKPEILIFGLDPKVKKAIWTATNIVRKCVDLARAKQRILMENMKPVPHYQTGHDGITTCINRPEIIVDKLGNEHRLLAKRMSEVAGVGKVAAEQFIEGHTNFLNEMSKIKPKMFVGFAVNGASGLKKDYGEYLDEKNKKATS